MGFAGEINITSAHIRRTCRLQNLNLRSLRDKLHGEIGSLTLPAILPAGGNNKGMKNMALKFAESMREAKMPCFSMEGAGWGPLTRSATDISRM